jgi:hypothetical protein
VIISSHVCSECPVCQDAVTDRHLAGENCVKRDHANLCSYNPKQNGPKASGSSIGGTKRARSPESESSLRKEEDRWPRTTGKRTILSSLGGSFPFETISAKSRP